MGRCVASFEEGQSPCPLPAGSGRRGPVVGGAAAQGFRPFLHGTEGRKKKQDKDRGRRWLLRPVTSARSAGSYRGFGCIKSGVKNRQRGSRLWSQSPNSYCHNEKTGVTPRKGAVYGKKERFAFYLTPEKKAILERRFQEDGSRSMTAFVERAVDFYLDYLSANDAGLFLPTSIKSYLDGRLGQLEERLSSLTFRQAVEQDMVAASWRTPISSAMRISAAGGRRASTM